MDNPSLYARRRPLSTPPSSPVPHSPASSLPSPPSSPHLHALSSPSSIGSDLHLSSLTSSFYNSRATSPHRGALVHHHAGVSAEEHDASSRTLVIPSLTLPPLRETRGRPSFYIPYPSDFPEGQPVSDSEHEDEDEHDAGDECGDQEDEERQGRARGPARIKASSEEELERRVLEASYKLPDRGQNQNRHNRQTHQSHQNHLDQGPREDPQPPCSHHSCWSQLYRDPLHLPTILSLSVSILPALGARLLRLPLSTSRASSSCRPVAPPNPSHDQGDYRESPINKHARTRDTNSSLGRTKDAISTKHRARRWNASGTNASALSSPPPAPPPRPRASRWKPIGVKVAILCAGFALGVMWTQFQHRQ
ncbi:hypothetical protein BOTBODRAFT_39374 [Botryobasidium botryosum FD-172 SS1]|uniref:Uncharacterized protein n=1 Tax=Botryobasidium botryosum (strain FD-172 SS1) TaxID=930990 RepID=A0A067LU06_BOTB1|nr:hypothetical protein BOTBODRAFT_39374 [Botryobasidium botryosum FD-172 SS1]